MDRNYSRVVVQAPAKVNLTLDIVGRREDGYHLLDMVMQSVDLCDLLLIARVEGEGIRVTCSRPVAPEDERNIVYRAAMHFFRGTGLPAQGLSIHLDKRIPVEAGMAGGSADAAAVLVGLDRLFGTSLSPEQLQEIGLCAGADVPFCLTGGCAFVQGIGERVTPLPPLPPCFFVAVKPPVGMSTAAAFRLYDSQPHVPRRPGAEAMLAAVRAGDLVAVGNNMHNIFEQIAPPAEVGAIKGTLLRSGALGAVMTGSGTAVVGLFEREEGARQALRNLRGQAAEAALVRPEGQGPRILHTG